ncbi:hypothetical protein D3C73_1185650 [compost metagenome]
MQYMVKKHKAADLALDQSAPVGNLHRKSAFMFNRDRLLSRGIVSKKFISQLNGLVWRCAQERYPNIGVAAGRFDKLDDSLFWTELERARCIPEYASFVKFVEKLYAKTRDRYGL